MDSMNLNNTAPMQPAPEVPKKGPGKAIFLIIGLALGALLTALVMCIVLKTKSGETLKSVEGEGYESAEEAVTAYLNYLKEGNLEGVISTFAVESYVDNYDMDEYFEYMQQFNPFIANGGQMTTGFYFDSDMARDLNIESRRAYILYNLHKQLMQIISHETDEEEIVETISDGRLYTFDEDSCKSVMKFLSTDPELDSIDIGNFLEHEDFGLPDDGIKRTMKSLKKRWGADVEQVIVELEIADEDYTLFMLCVCYDGKWYIAEFNNPTALALGTKPNDRGLVHEDELP